MVDLIGLEKEFLNAHIKKGGVAVDFTMGNGHDTAWLSKAVGAEGKVYAFDIQEKALESTRNTLKEENCPDNCTLICDSHSNVLSYVKEKICVGVFNLGYLPGSGNKALTTLRPTTTRRSRRLYPCLTVTLSCLSRSTQVTRKADLRARCSTKC